MLDGLLFLTLLCLAVGGIASAIKAKDSQVAALLAVLTVVVLAQAAQIHKLTAALKSSQVVAIKTLELVSRVQEPKNK